MDFNTKLRKAIANYEDAKKNAWNAINADQDSEEAEELFGEYLDASSELQRLLEDTYGSMAGRVAYKVIVSEL